MGLPRPKTRGDCIAGPRPCPFVSCRHHLYGDETWGKWRPNFPDLMPWELKVTCSLDYADEGEHHATEVGPLLNVKESRVSQVEKVGAAKVRLAVLDERTLRPLP